MVGNRTKRLSVIRSLPFAAGFPQELRGPGTECDSLPRPLWVRAISEHKRRVVLRSVDIGATGWALTAWKVSLEVRDPNTRGEIKLAFDAYSRTLLKADEKLKSKRGHDHDDDDDDHEDDHDEDRERRHRHDDD